MSITYHTELDSKMDCDNCETSVDLSSDKAAIIDTSGGIIVDADMKYKDWAVLCPDCRGGN